jgi:formiminotetrahydrofolate cyclodeaminase
LGSTPFYEGAVDFIKQFESASLVPAGGAAAAYSFCLGVALIYKVSLIENQRVVERPELEKNLFVLKKEIERLLRDAEKLVTEDAEAYLQFRKSRRENDPQAMKQAFSRAMDVSLKVIEKSFSAFEWIRQLQLIVPKALFTHLRVASELVMGSVNATVHVVKDNILGIRSEARRESYLSQIQMLQEKCKRNHFEIIDKLN